MDDFELRPARAEEIDDICAVINRCEEHDRLPTRLSRTELEEDFAAGHFEPALDARSVYVGGRLVGSGRVWFEVSGHRQERAYLFGEIDPQHRGAGLGRALLAWQIERARALLSASTPGLPRYVRTAAQESLVGAHRLYDRFGLAAVRHYDEMVVPLTAIPDVPVPDEVEIVAWPHERSEELRVAKNVAFAEHWGSAPVTPESWEGWLGTAHVRRDLSVVALDRGSGAIAGHCVVAHHPADEAASGRRDGWIDNVGTLPEWRGKGVAAAMIVTCLNAFRAAGFTHGILAVDRENETGAQALYRRLGFETVNTVVQRELALG